MKILHTADIHLDSPLRSLALRGEGLRERVGAASRRAFERIVDVAIDEGAAALLISGDLFDGQERSARTAAFFLAQAARLAEADVDIFWIKGNHDAANPVAGEMMLPGNVHLFDGRGGKVQLAEDVWIHGVSFSRPQAPESLLPKFPAPVPGAVNIAMLHTSLAGAPGHDRYAPCTPAELAAAGFDYWALGHVHRRQVHSEAPWIVMPGMPQGRDQGEAGPKSATLLTIENGRIEVEEVPTSEVEFASADLDVTSFEETDALRAGLRRAVEDAAGALASPTGILRLRLTGGGPLGWTVLRDRDVWTETLREMAESTGRLWLEKAAFDLDLSAPAASGGADAAAELGALMTEIRAEDGFRAEALREVEAMLSALPHDARAALAPDAGAAEALADRLSDSGALRMLALMKGAAG